MVLHLTGRFGALRTQTFSLLVNFALADVRDFEPARPRWGARVGRSRSLGSIGVLGMRHSSPASAFRAVEILRQSLLQLFCDSNQILAIALAR